MFSKNVKFGKKIAEINSINIESLKDLFSRDYNIKLPETIKVKSGFIKVSEDIKSESLKWNSKFFLHNVLEYSVTIDFIDRENKNKEYKNLVLIFDKNDILKKSSIKDLAVISQVIDGFNNKYFWNSLTFSIFEVLIRKHLKETTRKNSEVKKEIKTADKKTVKG